jgi:2,5-furandicarboxylate decarboxylase 1
MPFQDFREFLGALRKHGELIDIDRPVALELEVAKALRKSASVGGPACVFKPGWKDYDFPELRKRDAT